MAVASCLVKEYLKYRPIELDTSCAKASTKKIFLNQRAPAIGNFKFLFSPVLQFRDLALAHTQNDP